MEKAGGLRPVLGGQRVNEFAAEDRGFGPAPRLLGGGSEMVPGSVRFRVGMAVDPVQVSDESVEEGGGPLRVPGSAGEEAWRRRASNVAGWSAP